MIVHLFLLIETMRRRRWEGEDSEIVGMDSASEDDRRYANDYVLRCVEETEESCCWNWMV